MNARAPETFVRVDVSHASEYMLIHQQRFDSRAAICNLLAELFCRSFERIEPEFAQQLFAPRFRNNLHAAETPRIAEAQFAAIIEREENVRVRCDRFIRGADGQLAGHAEMNQNKKPRILARARLEFEMQEFAVAANGDKPASRNLIAEQRQIFYHIDFPRAKLDDSPPGQNALQAAHNGFDFRKFRHKNLLAKMARANENEFSDFNSGETKCESK